MAITAFQRTICKLISSSRKSNGSSYIAGGVSLNSLTNAPRISHDIDIFNDTHKALQYGWENDKLLLEENRFTISIIRERPTFIEALIAKFPAKVPLTYMFRLELLLHSFLYQHFLQSLF